MNIEKATYIDFFKQIKSGIGIDAAKNHTGVVIWNGRSVETYGFAIPSFDKSDPYAEYRMRREFKKKLGEIVAGRTFEYCIIEDVYGGENFDTVRKLLAINTVIDELIFDGVCQADNFVRWLEPVWLKSLRGIYKQSGRPKPKIEVQGVLEFLEFPFYMEHKDDKDKLGIFFEDICDAAGMLLGVVANKILEVNIAKQIPVKLKDVKMYYIPDLTEMCNVGDKRVECEGAVYVDLNTRSLEKSILSLVQQYPNDVLIAELPSSKLGTFGVKMKFMFYDSDECHLIFYKK